jgi:hypothetical protein
MTGNTYRDAMFARGGRVASLAKLCSDLERATKATAEELELIAAQMDHGDLVDMQDTPPPSGQEPQQ